jgi:ATP-dependent Clp protease protease subunit
MDLKYFKNQGDGVYDILLTGIVGEKLDGDDIAKEIKFLNEIGAKVIKEHINSIGGSLVNGLSIVSANINSNAEIHTINEGMAGSIMSVILASGTPGKRFGFDFSTAVIHNPSFDGVSLEDIQDEKVKSELKKLKESLVQIYANNTKLTKGQARRIMTEDTMLDSAEQLKIGLIDSVLPSKMKPIITKNMSYADIMNVCSDKDKFQDVTNKDLDPDNNNQNTKKMSDLTKFYNLSDDAAEASILKEAQKDRSKLELTENKVKALEKSGGEKDTEITNLKEEVKKYQNEAKQHQDEAIEVAVEADIKAGKFTEDKKDELIANAKNIGLEAYKAFTESVPVSKVDILSKIDNKTGQEDGEKKSKEQKLAEKWQDLITNDKAEAERIKNEDPKSYEAYVEAWNNY